MAFSPDNSRLAIADQDGRVHCQHLRDDRHQLICEGGIRPVEIEFSNSGQSLDVTGYMPNESQPGCFDILKTTYDLASVELVGSLQVASAIAMLPGEFPNGFPLFRFEPPETDDFARLSNTGRVLACMFGDTVRVCHLDTGKVFDLVGHSEVVMNCEFSRDDTLLATCSQDKITIVWDVQTGRQIHSLRDRTLPVGLSFSGDKTTLAVGDIEGCITYGTCARRRRYSRFPLTKRSFRRLLFRLKMTCWPR